MLIPRVGQGLNGSVDTSFAFRKETAEKYEGVEASSPSMNVAKGYAAIYVSYLGSYDARNTSALDQRMRPALCT